MRDDDQDRRLQRFIGSFRKIDQIAHVLTQSMDGTARSSSKSDGSLVGAKPLRASPEFMQMLRYAVAAADSAFPSTTYASSSFTRYRNALSPALSPDAFFPLTWPQIVSTGCPNVFLLISRFISSNSADAGSSSFAATEVLAFFRIGSEPSAFWAAAGHI